ncbi:MAG: PAS domain-containing protein [Holophagaceae bacterium]
MQHPETVSPGVILPPGGSEPLLREILASMFAGVALVRASDARIVFANARFAEMFGYGPGGLEGQPVAILNAPGAATPEETAEAITAQLRDQGVWKGEIENIRKDGQTFWTLARVTTFDHPGLGPVWVVVQLDVTAQRRAEEALRRSQERLELVLEATHCGAWDWNVQTGEVYFSPYWIRSLGYAPEEIPPVVASWERLVHPDDLQRVREALDHHFSGATDSYECVDRLRRKDGTWRWNLDRGRVVTRTPEGAPLRMVGIDTDLSEQQWSGLKQFTSICAGCKKIREESGEWLSLEAHFEGHSQAQFTHGLCPDCIRQYYGEASRGGK